MAKVEERTWLKTIRKSRGYSLRGFAKEVGLSPSYYCEIEKGIKTPAGKTGFLIAEKLGFKMEKFY